MAIPDCGHCGDIQEAVNETCKKNNWQVNHLVLVYNLQYPNGCNCTCSCLAFGTPVQTGDGDYRAVEKYEVGHTVLACGVSLEWNPERVEFSNGTPGAAVQRHAVLVVYKDTALAVTSDHLFLMGDRKLRRADRLAAGDILLDPQGIPVPIMSVHIGNMHAGFHHIATRKEEPQPGLERHLLNTNGVISADYAVQLYYRNPDQRKKAFSTHFVDEHDDLPIVGSPEYIARYGEKCQHAPETEAAFMKVAPSDTHVRVSMSNARDQGTGVFVPAQATKITVPDGARGFISQQDAELRAASPKRPFNDPHSRGWTEWLLEYHEHFYPDIKTSLDWASNEVNAYAWVDHGTGQRRIDIKGGLVRDVAIELEGIALVIAHEIGHHYGGPPTGGHPDGLSCEGQADFEGVATIMRKVWFGSHYPSTVAPAIAQMADFFGVPNTPTVPSGSAGCDHPAGECRIASYYAAAALESKPACAS